MDVIEEQSLNANELQDIINSFSFQSNTNSNVASASSVPTYTAEEFEEIIEQTIQDVENDIAIEETTETTETIETESESIPLIPESVLVYEGTIRFNSAEWFDLMTQQTITIAGLGGIGSNLAYLIGKLRPQCLRLYDFDKIEAVNLAGQFYSYDDIGEQKDSAIIRKLNRFCNYYGTYSCGRVTVNSYLTPITLCGFDNMKARKDCYTAWKRAAKYEGLYMDARLNAEEFQILCFTSKDKYLMELYERDWLFSDEEAEETICSYKQTAFCAMMVASIMTNLLVNYISNLCEALIERPLPFLTTYNAQTMMLNTRL